jgi:hypothetical protein
VSVIRYKYAALDPPAPMIHVEVRDPTGGGSADREAALIDHGADRTVIPVELVRAIDLPSAGLRTFKGFGSDEMELHVYAVEIILRDRPPVQIEAIHGEGEPYILLGRDVLNRFKILDGPGLALEIL